MHEIKSNQLENTIQQADGVEIIYYTDPLCCWSWAFEPQWRKLLYEFGGKINHQCIMGGLLPGWKNYNDSLNSVSRPIQMGPVWMHAAQLSGMPIQHTIWFSDPPATSYPACVAVKCAQIQSSQTGENYLRLLREAVMLNGKNIAKEEILFEAAAKLAQQNALFNYKKFKKDFKSEIGIELFRNDLKQVQYHNINRFPTLIIKGNENAVMITGYRPYSVLIEAIKQVAPHLKKQKKISNVEEYKDFWQTITQREIDEAFVV